MFNDISFAYIDIERHLILNINLCANCKNMVLSQLKDSNIIQLELTCWLPSGYQRDLLNCMVSIFSGHCPCYSLGAGNYTNFNFAVYRGKLSDMSHKKNYLINAQMHVTNDSRRKVLSC